MRQTAINLRIIRSGPIRHAKLPPALVLRIKTVQAALADACPLSEAEWQDSFRRDANPEQEVLWWERTAGCYISLTAAAHLSADEQQTALKVIVGLFSGLKAEQLWQDCAKLPQGAINKLSTIMMSIEDREG